MLHSRHLRGPGVFRVLFFLPYVVPFVAGVLIWGGMLNPDTGWVNLALQCHRDRRSARLAGRSGLDLPGAGDHGRLGHRGRHDRLPRGTARASRPTSTRRRAIDGAGAWPSLRHITIPMMSPVIFYTIVLAVVEVLQYFLVPLVLKNGTGEPGGSTNFFNLYLYKNFFTFQNMSYGATLAWLLFAITLAITLILFGTARRWVYYAGEAR